MKESQIVPLTEQELEELEAQVGSKLDVYPSQLNYNIADHGFDYQPVTFMLDEQDRCLLIGRIGDVLATPRIVSIEDGQLRQRPLLSSSRQGKLETAEGYATRKNVRLHPYEGNNYELVAEIIENNALEYILELRVSRKERTVLIYDTEKRIFTVDRSDSGLIDEPYTKFITLHEPLTKLHCIVHKQTIEIFINDGEAVMSTRINTSESADGIRTSAVHGDVYLKLWKYDLKDA
ncbi:GH32 C-terminal domain-containing protein [Macrococcoides caseolyticum]|nr:MULTISPECIES: GH32 C-terminal domain-containing protein [Macrococcus]QQB04626.1 GH32 C-terminal domain-containing protein [Macrococcus caseolyticus]QYA32620.1 GH32 C-terminal domain-containing protein [Macrococcus sp. 19Msa1099]QYA37431.1 GH32 C-terminal domain-containing protein [Macrococcus caseolyticus]QYA76138.1 GH32 C-terminal domain-containing protein [Macrococcus caseolyticus]